MGWLFFADHHAQSLLSIRVLCYVIRLLVLKSWTVHLVLHQIIIAIMVLIRPCLLPGSILPICSVTCMSIFFLVRCLEPELKTCPSASSLILGSLAKTFSQTCHPQSYFSHSLQGNDLPALHLPAHYSPPFPRQSRIRPCKSRTPLVFLLRKTNK